ncbi:MAG: hypothetical protein JO081_01600 [Alphaproteobacteria bacterium]|nr:hypothetical protein [Alphaproteobacteria bacterium]
MGTCLRQLCVLAAIMLSVIAAVRADEARTTDQRPAGTIFDITHFDVIPLNIGGVDFEQVAYPALFKYRDASQSDLGFKSFRILNWLEATNHSFIVDVWSSQEAFEEHLAQSHSVAFRFAVQNQPPDGICCIGSPIDDRQYSMVASFGTPWVGNGLPSKVGSGGALFVITYVDFLQELLEEGDPDRGPDSLVKYGADSIKANPGYLLNFTVLRQLDRPNRLIILEVWDTQSDYSAWQAASVTQEFTAEVTPLLGSPLDNRLNSLCGETYVDSTQPTPPPNGCVPP